MLRAPGLLTRSSTVCVCGRGQGEVHKEKGETGRLTAPGALVLDRRGDKGRACGAHGHKKLAFFFF